MPRSFQALLQKACQRQIHIVAAQQDMVANSDALQHQFAVLFGDHNEAEVRRAASDVAYENEIADLDSAAPRIALAFEPSIERSLGLLEQGDVLIPGAFGSASGQFTCFFIERSRHSDQHVLLRESKFL